MRSRILSVIWPSEMIDFQVTIHYVWILYFLPVLCMEEGKEGEKMAVTALMLSYE